MGGKPWRCSKPGRRFRMGCICGMSFMQRLTSRLFSPVNPLFSGKRSSATLGQSFMESTSSEGQWRRTSRKKGRVKWWPPLRFR